MNYSLKNCFLFVIEPCKCTQMTCFFCLFSLEKLLKFDFLSHDLTKNPLSRPFHQLIFKLVDNTGFIKYPDTEQTIWLSRQSTADSDIFRHVVFLWNWMVCPAVETVNIIFRLLCKVIPSLTPSRIQLKTNN